MPFNYNLFTEIVAWIIFFFSVFYLIKLSKKLGLLKKVLLSWLIPVIPIIFIVGRLYPKSEACGFGICIKEVFIALGSGAAWFIYFPLVIGIFLFIKSSNKVHKKSDIRKKTKK